MQLLASSRLDRVAALPTRKSSRNPIARGSTQAVASPLRPASGIEGRRGDQREQEARQLVAAREGPAASLASCWALYLTSLQRRPLLTKALTSFVLTVVGDSLAQAIGAPAPYSFMRACKLGVWGASAGAVGGHFWHAWLDKTILPEKPASVLAVVQKVVLDQMLFSPAMLVGFLTYVSILEGRPDFSFIQDKLVSTLLAGYTFWPAANVFAFRFIPADLRILFGSLLGLGWGTFLSLSCVNPSA